MSRSRLTCGPLLARNVVWNLFGVGSPLLVALWAIPYLIDKMGTERFGLLSIIWMGVGYFSLFDFGIGRALTKLVSERLGNGRVEELPSLISTGLKLMFGLGTFAAIVVAAIAPWLVRHVLNIPDGLVDEAMWSFWLLAVTLPFVVSTAGQVGILQAHQRFAHISTVRIPLGIITFLGPILALQISPSLVATVIILAIARILAWLVYRRLCGPYLGGGSPLVTFDRTQARALLEFGGWITVSNVVGPLMVYFDRFLIGALLTMTAVAYYTTPYEVVTRLWIVPEAFVGVLFPALTAAMVADPTRAGKIFMTAGQVLLLVMLPLAALIILFSPEALTLWLGSDFARESSPVLRWLVIGVFINCLARLPSVTLQSCGRPDLNAKIHLVELIPYVLVLWALINSYGIVGAAIAWTLRITVDTVALYTLTMRQTHSMRTIQVKILILTVCSSVLLGILALPQQLWFKVSVAALIMVLWGVVALRERTRWRGGRRGVAVVAR
jgi:O-antigen/teichoic acid export membrane protein